jgi:hypothetical protein
MLIPRYSLRTVLMMTAGAALFFLIAGLAYRGHDWAERIVVATAIFALVMLVHAGLYAIVWAISQLSSGSRNSHRVESEAGTST